MSSINDIQWQITPETQMMDLRSIVHAKLEAPKQAPAASAAAGPSSTTTANAATTSSTLFTLSHLPAFSQWISTYESIAHSKQLLQSYQQECNQLLTQINQSQATFHQQCNELEQAQVQFQVEERSQSINDMNFT